MFRGSGALITSGKLQLRQKETKQKNHTIHNKQINKKQTQGTLIHFYYDILRVTMLRHERKLKGSIWEDTAYKDALLELVNFHSTVALGCELKKQMKKISRL